MGSKLGWSREDHDKENAVNTCPVCKPYPRPGYQQLSDGSEVPCYACNRAEFEKQAVTGADIASSRFPRQGEESSAAPVHEYDVTVQRCGFSSYNVTAHSENVKKLLGIGTFTYEESEWKKLNKELRNYTYTIEVR